MAGAERGTRIGKSLAMGALALLVAWGVSAVESAGDTLEDRRAAEFGGPHRERWSPDVRLGRSQEILAAFPELEGIAPATEDAPTPELVGDSEWQEPDVDAWAAQHAGPHGFALLRRILESDATPPPLRAEFLRRHQFPNGFGLRAAADAETDRLLLRALRWPHATEMVWIDCLTALGRPGVSDAGLDGLVDLVLDDTMPPQVRRSVLERLTELGSRLPLQVAALASMPGLEAGELIRGIFRDRPEAAVWLDPPAAAEVRQSVIPASRDDLLSMPEADIDPAVGAVLLLRGERDARAAAEDLDRIARFVRRDVERAPDPAAKLEALCRPLRCIGWSYNEERTDVREVLRGGQGNCVSLSLIVVGVARRLGLPVSPVYSPGHMFVRWDDGTTRLNLDPNGGWRSYDDAWYVEEMDAVPGRSPDLETIPPRAALAIVALNGASTRCESGDLAGAREMLRFAEAADERSPMLPTANAALALVAAPHDRAAARKHLRGCGVRDVSRHLYVAYARLFLATGAADETLAWVDAAIARGPSSPDLRIERARCLLALGRMDELHRTLRDLRTESPDSTWLAAVEADVRRRSGDADWLSRVSAGSSDLRVEKLDDVVKHLLTNGDPSKESAQAALDAADAAKVARGQAPGLQLNVTIFGDDRPQRARALEILGRTKEAATIREQLERARRER